MYLRALKFFSASMRKIFSVSKACLLFVFVGGVASLQATFATGFQAVIFDCDGVLVDTEYLKFLAWQGALDAQGIPFSIEEYIPLVGHSSKNILEGIRKAKKIDLPKEVITAKNVEYKRLQKQGVVPIREMVDFALHLFKNKEKLGIQLGLASSAPKEQILANLRQIGLEDIFDLILSGSDDLTHYVDEEGTNKPKPYIYMEMAKQLGVSPELCLVFEDTKAGVDAAKGAGMVPVAVPNKLTFNHDFSNADRIISSYKEVLFLGF